jgi:hypothetical protein
MEKPRSRACGSTCCGTDGKVLVRCHARAFELLVKKKRPAHIVPVPCIVR